MRGPLRGLPVQEYKSNVRKFLVDCARVVLLVDNNVERPLSSYSIGLIADTASATGFNSKSVRIETKLIHERSGRFSTIYVSEDASGLRTLRFGANGARQSVIDMHNPRSLVLRYTR